MSSSFISLILFSYRSADQSAEYDFAVEEIDPDYLDVWDQPRSIEEGTEFHPVGFGLQQAGPFHEQLITAFFFQQYVHLAHD